MKRSRLMAGVVFLVASALVGIVGMLGPSSGGDASIPQSSSAKVSRHLKDAAHDTAETAISVATSDFLDDFHQRRRRAADAPDGTVFDEPAHTRMCRVIIERLDQYDDSGSAVMTFPQVILTESEYVCRDPDAPHTSVLAMFAAQLLHEANNLLGLNVDYTHRCARWERFCTGNLTTVQFHLPDPLSTNAHAYQPGCMDTSASLRAVCSGCLSGDDPTDPNCVLFPSGGYLDAQADNVCDLGCHFRQVLPWIRNNLRIVAQDWLNTVETRALTFWLRNAAEFSHREKDDMEVSVIALSCKNDMCDMSMPSCVCDFDPLPNWVYAMHVPRSSTNVAIIVSPTCAKFGTGCTLHAQELYHFLHRLYPRSDITYNVITSTSSWYMRMITADHLVCPPGDGCLLPAIARDAYTYVYETTSPVVSTWLTCAPTDYVNRLTIPIFPPEFVQGDCRHLRARVGSWTGDATLAASMQYSNAVDGYLGCADENFVATPDLPYRRPTTYRWDESIWATCPVNLASKVSSALRHAWKGTRPALFGAAIFDVGGDFHRTLVCAKIYSHPSPSNPFFPPIPSFRQGIFCNQMNRIGLERILFVGDHTTMTQAISLASILGQNDDISLDTNVVPNFSKTISCEPGSNSTFELAYVRNDRLEEPTGANASPSPGSPNCGPDGEQYCYPWSTDYSSGIGKTLLIVNTGYHWGDDWEGYIANFQNFVGKIDDVATANPVRVSNPFFVPCRACSDITTPPRQKTCRCSPKIPHLRCLSFFAHAG